MIKYFIKADTSFVILHKRKTKCILYKGSKLIQQGRKMKSFKNPEKLNAFIEKTTNALTKKGFDESKLNPSKFNAFFNQVKLKTPYYFIKKNNQSLIDSEVASIAIKQEYENFGITRFSFEKTILESEEEVDYPGIENFKFAAPSITTNVSSENLKAE